MSNGGRNAGQIQPWRHSRPRGYPDSEKTPKSIPKSFHKDPQTTPKHQIILNKSTLVISMNFDFLTPISSRSLKKWGLGRIKNSLHEALEHFIRISVLLLGMQQMTTMESPQSLKGTKAQAQRLSENKQTQRFATICVKKSQII